MLGIALALLSGGFATLAAPQHGEGWLILVAFVPMFVAEHRVLPARLAGLATAIGAAGTASGSVAGVFQGVDIPFTTDLLIWGGVVALGLGAGVLGTLDRRIAAATGYRFWVVALPALWGGLDVIRLHLPFAGTDGFLAYDLAHHPSLLQPVSVVGIVTFDVAIILVNTTLSAIVMGVMGLPAVSAPRIARLASVLLVGLGGWSAWSWSLLGRLAPTVTVAAVQPGLSYSSPLPLSTLVSDSRPAVAAGATLVVWPEQGVSGNPCLVSAELAEIVGMARVDGAYVVVGIGHEGPQSLNEAVVVSPQGRCFGPYAKHHPDPRFGEHLVVNTGYLVYRTSIGPISTIICFDSDFTDSTRAVAAKGAELVAVPSSDSSGVMGRIHYTEIVFRAIENRVTLVKADTDFDSAVVDPYGRIVASSVTTSEHRGIVLAKVPLGSGQRTVWNRWATVIEVSWLCAGAAGLASMAFGLRRYLLT